MISGYDIQKVRDFVEQDLEVIRKDVQDISEKLEKLVARLNELEGEQ